MTDSAQTTIKLLTDQRNGRWQSIAQVLVQDADGEVWWDIEVIPNRAVDYVDLRDRSLSNG